jgi:glutamate 5-kinase
MGGTIPGITTDTDSVLLAEAIGAKRLVNISNVDAVYDSDPKKNPNAKQDLEHLPPEQLVASILQKEQRIAEIMMVTHAGTTTESASAARAAAPPQSRTLGSARWSARASRSRIPGR